MKWIARELCTDVMVIPPFTANSDAAVSLVKFCGPKRSVVDAANTAIQKRLTKKLRTNLRDHW